MKDWIKKYKLIVIIAPIAIIIIFSWPLIVNWLYNVETNCKVLHKPQEWTIFWGSYIGSIVSAAVAFIILFLQREDNIKENEKNRTLQLKILEQQQEMQWLNMFKQAYIEYIAAYSLNNILEVVNKVRNNSDEAYYLIKTVIDRMENAKLMIELLWKSKEKDDIRNIVHKNYISTKYVLKDMSCVIGFLIRNEYETILGDFIGSPAYKQASTVLKEIAEKKINHVLSENKELLTLQNKELDRKIALGIISERFQLYQENNKNKDIRDLLLNYIKEQEVRINAITNI